MKYRGQAYDKISVALDTVVETEMGKYRGVTARYATLKAAVSRLAGRRKYRGASF